VIWIIYIRIEYVKRKRKVTQIKCKIFENFGHSKDNFQPIKSKCNRVIQYFPRSGHEINILIGLFRFVYQRLKFGSYQFCTHRRCIKQEFSSRFSYDYFISIKYWRNFLSAELCTHKQ